MQFLAFVAVVYGAIVSRPFRMAVFIAAGCVAVLFSIGLVMRLTGH